MGDRHHQDRRLHLLARADGVVSFIFHYAFFRLISLPYAFALAAWVGVVSQFIPTVGTYIAGASADHRRAYK